MRPSDILTQVAELVEQRERDHGAYHHNFDLIAKLWSNYLDAHISARQVATMMVLLKIARQKTSPKTDDFDDAVGYAALAAALFEREEGE